MELTVALILLTYQSLFGVFRKLEGLFLQGLCGYAFGDEECVLKTFVTFGAVVKTYWDDVTLKNFEVHVRSTNGDTLQLVFVPVFQVGSRES